MDRLGLNLSGKDAQMQVGRFSIIVVMTASLILLGGCVASSEYESLKAKNLAQQERIDQIDSELAAAKLKLEQLTRQLAAAQSKGDATVDSLKQEIAALEADIAKKKALIASMQQRLLGGVALPAELNVMLQDFAATNPELITYDESTGVIKFKSDLLFEKGSDVVSPEAAEVIKKLCSIMNTDKAKEFDIIVAGHTDDIPILKPDTRQKHPTNWHLSVHRAISVEQTMETSGVEPRRLSVRGFSEYRPIEENKPNKAGNPRNRRVEVYIVPEGV
jgi:chemotaxis protein MotB